MSNILYQYFSSKYFSQCMCTIS